MKGEFFETFIDAHQWMPFDVPVDTQRRAHHEDADRFHEWTEWLNDLTLTSNEAEVILMVIPDNQLYVWASDARDIGLSLKQAVDAVKSAQLKLELLSGRKSTATRHIVDDSTDIISDDT